VPIFAVMLQERHRLPKIRACMDYWADWIEKQTNSVAQSLPKNTSKHIPKLTKIKS
jgi:hypothetical protein